RLPDGSSFAGCPRTVLKNVVQEAAQKGFKFLAGLEVEFFLFLRGADGQATRITHDVGGYFDLAPVDRGEEARRDMVITLEGMGLQVGGASNEMPRGRH